MGKKNQLELLEKVVSQNPESVEALNELALAYEKKGDYTKAEACLLKAIALKPRCETAYVNLGNVENRLHKPDIAMRAYQEALRLNPESLTANVNLGVVLEQKGQADGAATCFQKAISVDPKCDLAHYNLAKALRGKGDLDLALKYLERAIRLNDKDSRFYNELGIVFKAKGLLEEAICAFQGAIKINSSNPRPYHNLGNIFLNRGHLERAVWLYTQALRNNPDFAEAHFHLGIVHKMTGDSNKALFHYNRAVQIQPSLVEAQYRLYNELVGQERIDEAIEKHRVAEDYCPDDMRTWLNGLNRYRLTGDWESLGENLNKLLEYAFSTQETRHFGKFLFELGGTDVASERIRDKYEKYGNLMAERCSRITPNFEPSDYKTHRLRIGYISPDFREHSMGYFSESILAHHNTSQFEVFCYSLSRHEDQLTNRIEKLPLEFQRVHSRTAGETAKLIHKDRINILVDLASHTSGTCIETLAKKPAPIILTHIGQAGGTGLRTVDYKVTDYYSDPHDAAEDYVEKLIRIPGCVYPYVKILPPDNMPGKKDWGIPEGSITFAAFCAIRKLNARLLSVWGRILDKLQNGVLLFSPPQVYKKYFVKVITSCGIDVKRIRFLDTTGSFQPDQSRYGVVDIALDTFPYGGGITSINALNMCVPVVTLKGYKHGERMTYSILSNLGVSETIACNEEEYISIACRLGRDSELREKVRKEISKGLKKSVLVDMKLHTQHLERAYKKVWERFVNGKEPKELRI